MPLDEARFRQELTSLRRNRPTHGLGAALLRPLGEVLVTFDEIASTNDEAIQAARRGALHGTVFVADSQAAGRGRRGRRWSSNRGENLLVSVLLRPNLDLRTASRLTLAVGLAVREAASVYVATAPRIKWPNDVLVGTKKLAGILVESQISGASLDSVIVGVGLNVSSRTFPEEIADLATSLALCEARPGAPELGLEGVLARVLIQLEWRLAEFEQRGLTPMLEELRRHDALLGSHVRIDEHRGVARGIDQNGALVLEAADGRFFRIETGTVELD